MELSQVNNNQFHNVTSSLLQNSELKSSQGITSQNSKNYSEKLDILSNAQTPLVSHLSNSIDRLANLQNAQQMVQSQLETISTLEMTIKSSPSQSALDSVQPQVQNAIATYNTSAKTLSSNIEKIVEEKQSDESRTYFDGILGAKPLSADEILEAVDEKRENLEQFNKLINDQIVENITKASSTIDSEKATPFNTKTQEIDFKIESENFNKKLVQRFEGSQVESQANANSRKSIPLLAS